MKVALVHDWLPFMGGAENVLINMTEIFPNAPIYTTISNLENLDEKLKHANIITSHLQKNKSIKNHRYLFPFMPTAMEHFNLNNYDIVISSSTSVGKCVITNPNTLHICYCNTPMRYAWEFMHDYIGPLEGAKSIKEKAKAYFMSLMRMWDYVSSARVDVFVGNSVNVAKRIKKHYRRDEVFVIHPPVRCNLFEPTEVNEDYFLCVSRLQEYKRIDLAIEACNELKIKLIVIGDGPERVKLEKIAGNTIQFLGRVSNEQIKEYYSKCKAFIFPGEEDYGITPLEAQASGRPVIAYGKGGALETIIPDKTGVFFYEQTTKSLIDAINRFEDIAFDKKVLRNHALEFDESIFKNRLERFVKEQYKQFLETKQNGISLYK